MKKPSLHKWPRLLAAISIGIGSLILTPTAHAAEDLPKNHFLHKDAEDVLENYIRKSRETLKRFDELLIKDYVSVQDEWLSKSREMSRLLEDSYRKVKEIHVARTMPPPMPVMKKWYEQEAACWENIETIGKEFVGMHDSLGHHTYLIEEQYLGEMKETRRKAEEYGVKVSFYLSKGLEILGYLTGIAQGQPPSNQDPLSDTVKAFDELGNSLNPIAAAVEKLLLRQESSIVNFVKEVAKSNYKDNLSKLISKKVDIDQSGVYYQYERDWEDDLKIQLSRFEKSYGQYKVEATPFLENFLAVRITSGSSKIAQYFRLGKGDKTDKFDETAMGAIESMKDDAEELVETIVNRKD